MNPFKNLAAIILAAGAVGFFSTTTRAGIINLNFSSAVAGTIQDSAGNGTGFTARLSGTGGSIATKDPNLTMNTGASPSNLSVTANSASDFNGSKNLGTLEALGVDLSSLGYTGTQNFSVSATFSFPSGTNIGNNYNQFGVYVGTSATATLRDGYIAFNTTTTNGSTPAASFVQTNNTGTDIGGPANGETFNAGDTIVAAISRTNGNWSETVSDTTSGWSNSYTTAAPSNVSGSGLNVGIYAINGFGNTNPYTLPVTQFTASVATPEPASAALCATGAMGLLLVLRKRKGTVAV